VLVCAAGIIITGLFKKVPVFDEFLVGAKDGLHSAVKVAPALVALVASVSMLRASGAIGSAVEIMKPLFAAISIPPEVFPLALMRPISGSGALAVLKDIFSSSGPDSHAGLVASVMMGSSETTFYTIAVYYGSVGIKKLGATVPAALMADITGFIFSVLAVLIFF
jgi:spore maturation protein B